MRFLSTLFWVLLAVIVVLFASRNWNDVTLNLWGDIQADVKIPFLLLIVFLIGFVPPWVIMRARVWGHRRRLEAIERQQVAVTAPAAEDESPVSRVRWAFVFRLPSGRPPPQAATSERSSPLLHASTLKLLVL